MLLFTFFLCSVFYTYSTYDFALSGIVLGINWRETLGNWWDFWFFGCNIHGEISFQTLQNFWVAKALMITRTKFFVQILPRLRRFCRVCVFLNLGEVPTSCRDCQDLVVMFVSFYILVRSRGDLVEITWKTNILPRLSTSHPDLEAAKISLRITTVFI